MNKRRVLVLIAIIAVGAIGYRIITTWGAKEVSTDVPITTPEGMPRPDGSTPTALPNGMQGGDSSSSSSQQGTQSDGISESSGDNDTATPSGDTNEGNDGESDGDSLASEKEKDLPDASEGYTPSTVEEWQNILTDYDPDIDYDNSDMIDDGDNPWFEPTRAPTDPLPDGDTGAP